MTTFAAIIALLLGLVATAVVSMGLVKGEFPFRPRHTGTCPEGTHHRLNRNEEPFLYWFVVAGMGGTGLSVIVVGIALLVRLARM